MTIQELNAELGNIDLYLLDQVLKGRITKDMKILDAGCGEGRNLIYFINNEYNVYGVDQNKSAIKYLRLLAKNYQPERFVHSSLEEMIFPPEVFDYIISSAVLHFAQGHAHFDLLMQSMIKVLKPGGSLFIRMTTDIGLDCEISDTGIAHLPDGSKRYIFEMKKLSKFLKQYGLELAEPFKSVVVHDARSMGAMVFRKNLH